MFNKKLSDIEKLGNHFLKYLNWKDICNCGISDSCLHTHNFFYPESIVSCSKCNFPLPMVYEIVRITSIGEIKISKTHQNSSGCYINYERIMTFNGLKDGMSEELCFINPAEKSKLILEKELEKLKKQILN